MPRTAPPTASSELAKLAKQYNLDAIHDTVHEMARDEARHGKAFEGLLRSATSNKVKKGASTMKYECPCGYIYDPALGDPDSGIDPGTAWEDVPDDWVCPVCGIGKDMFSPAE